MMCRLSPADFRWLLPVLWMGLIFTGSSDLLSANHTSRFIEPFLRWLFHGSLSEQRLDDIHFLIRKAGHLCEYAVLCILFWWALFSPGKDDPAPGVRPWWHRPAFAVALAACFAATDEFHQSFVPTRGASVEDVLIDTVGAALGLSLFLAAAHVFHSIRRRPAI